jgi:hypothetical protein
MAYIIVQVLKVRSDELEENSWEILTKGRVEMSTQQIKGASVSFLCLWLPPFTVKADPRAFACFFFRLFILNIEKVIIFLLSI